MSRAEGTWGEAEVANYLRRRGYTLLAHGFHCRFGEIDLIARRRGVTAMVEVKARASDRFAQAMEYVDARKQQRIRLTAQQWLAQQTDDPQVRFDVVEVYPGGRVRHIENAFQ